MSKHMGTPRRTARFGPLVAILAAFGLVLGMLGLAAPAQATGNNGTIKIHEEGTPVGTEDNDPKVCSFNIESYNLDAGQDGSGGDDVAVVDEADPIGPVDVGVAASQSDQLQPVRGGRTVLEESGVGQHL